MDNAILRINHYPVDSAVCFVNTYPLDSNLSGGKRYLPFEQPGPDFLKVKGLSNEVRLKETITRYKMKFHLGICLHYNTYR